MSLTFLFKFIPKYFTGFDAIINEFFLKFFLGYFVVSV